MFAPNRHDRLIERPKTRYTWIPFQEYMKLELKPVGKPDREVALLSWTKMFRMSTYQNDLINILKNVCKESKLQIVEGSVVKLFFFFWFVTLWPGTFA